jgi:cardiolipin synthase A/B
MIAAVAVTTALGLLIVNFAGGEAKITRHMERVHAIDDPRFARELGLLLGPPFIEGNLHSELINGDQIFPEMLGAVRAATRTVNFETYIYWSGDIGTAFAEALSERARAGVSVRVLLDWMGSAKIEPEMLRQLEDAGVMVTRYHPPHWSTLGRLNNRTHRKLLVVDGRVGFTGGVGIAPEWTGNAQDPEHWRDTHFKVEGPVVGQMQAVFLDNWITATGKVLHGEAYFPTLEPRGNQLAQMFSSSPDGGSDSMQLMYLMSITAAERTIDLSAAYFVPDQLTMDALLQALQRGVRLRIVVPGRHIDSGIVRHASREQWGPLLRAGAVIAEYQPTMYHCKVLIVDGYLVSVGSTNFDNRSFRLNDEATLNILDKTFAARQTAIFEQDLQRSRVITHAEWQGRPLLERVKEQLASLIRSQL